MGNRTKRFINRMIATILAFGSVVSLTTINVLAEGVAEGAVKYAKYILPVIFAIYLITMFLVYIAKHKQKAERDENVENKQIAEQIYNEQSKKEVAEETDVMEDNIVEVIATEIEETQEPKEEVVEEVVVEEEPQEEPVEVVPVVEEEPQEEPVEVVPVVEEEPQEEIEEEETEEDAEPEEEDEDDGLLVLPKSIKREVTRRHFLTKLSTLDPEYNEWYSEIKNEFLRFRGVHSRVSFAAESFRYKGELIAKITVNGSILKVHFALDTEEFNYYKYYQVNEGELKAYIEVPMTVKVKSNRGSNNARGLVNILMAKLGIEQYKKYENTDYSQYKGDLHFSTLVRHNLEHLLVETASPNISENLMSNSLVSKLLEESRETLDIGISSLKAKEATIYVGDLEEKYRAYETVTLTSLKSRRVVEPDVTHVTVLAQGQLTKPLDIRVQDYSLPAAKMILAVGGNIVMRKLK